MGKRLCIRGIMCAIMLSLTLSLCPTLALSMGEEVSDDPFADAIEVELEDGTYLIDVKLEGGTGRADITSPAEVTVKDGKAAATIEWTSPFYDYMVVGGKMYLAKDTQETQNRATFLIPVMALDKPFDVMADTTAMTVPYEIAYKLTFDGSSSRRLRDRQDTRWVAGVI